VKFTTAGAASLFTNAGLNQPQGLAFDSAGNLYVANSGNDTIMKFDPAGNGSVFASGLGNH
jgi:DNA-binding beta-propeller fold protein YncE